MTFRSNFLIECFTSIAWTAINLGFYVLVVFYFTTEIGRGTGWHKYPFLVFLATGMIVNGLVQTFIMPNAEHFSELIRKGDLDGVLLKPIDTQFVVSFQRMSWSSLTTVAVGLGLMAFSLVHLDFEPGAWHVVLFVFYVVCGVAILYSLIISLASASVWMGRNQTLFDFWFYLTIFSRYPLEIYTGRLGRPLQVGFSFIVPILLAINVPARFLAKPLEPGQWRLAVFAVVATVGCLLASRWVFARALAGYRSASS